MRICAFKQWQDPIKTDAFIRVLAGTVLLRSVLFVRFVRPWSLRLTASAGLNLTPSAFTNTCPPFLLLRPLGRIDGRSVNHWDGTKNDSDTKIMNPILRILLIVAGGAALGALMGYFGECTSGTCPLTSTWWRGALFGSGLGLLIALGGRSS